MPEQIQEPLIVKPGRKQVHDEGGPKIPNVSKPDSDRRMRCIVPDQSRKFRQREGHFQSSHRSRPDYPGRSGGDYQLCRTRWNGEAQARSAKRSSDSEVTMS